MNEENIRFFIVSTPIGNLDDITFRAIECLKSSDIILCEDTRHSIKLLNHYNIKAKLISYHKFNENETIEKVLNLLSEDNKISLITDAGTPLISDPGYILVKSLIAKEIKFSVIPGANAILPALILSGLDTSEFMFIGFLDKKKSKRYEKLNEIKEVRQTLIFYSSPHDLLSFLNSIYEVFGDRQISISKEITKLFETTYRNKISVLINEFDSINIKGEFVVCVNGFVEKIKEMSLEEIKLIFDKEINEDIKSSDLIKKLSKKYNVNKRELYEYIMKKD